MQKNYTILVLNSQGKEDNNEDYKAYSASYKAQMASI